MCRSYLYCFLVPFYFAAFSFSICPLGHPAVPIIYGVCADSRYFSLSLAILFLFLKNTIDDIATMTHDSANMNGQIFTHLYPEMGHIISKLVAYSDSPRTQQKHCFFPWEVLLVRWICNSRLICCTFFAPHHDIYLVAFQLLEVFRRYLFFAAEGARRYQYRWRARRFSCRLESLEPSIRSLHRVFLFLSLLTHARLCFLGSYFD